jgi:hypothetical protein
MSLLIVVSIAQAQRKHRPLWTTKDQLMLLKEATCGEMLDMSFEISSENIAGNERVTEIEDEMIIGRIW